MRKIIVKIDKEKATELERVNFELNFVKDIVQRVIESHPSDLELINGDTLMSYNKRGAELQRKYAALANEMEKEYIPEYLEGHQYSWIIPNNLRQFLFPDKRVRNLQIRLSRNLSDIRPSERCVPARHHL